MDEQFARIKKNETACAAVHGRTVVFAKGKWISQDSFFKKTMKLALVRRSYSATGGAELYLQRLLEALRDARHEVHLFAEQWSEPPEGVEIHRIHIQASRARRPWAFARAVESALQPGEFDCVFSLERTLRQDVYRAGDGVHRVWLERRKQFSPWWRTLWTSQFHRAMLSLESETLNPANTRFLIVNSEMVRNEIRSHFDFPPDRIILVRNGVNVQRFRSGERGKTRERFGFAEDDFVCLFVGSGWERKGLNYVVEAVRKLPGRVKLLVAGKGQSFSSHLKVVFAGPVKEVENLYAAADLFTFVPIYEPSANVCIEALAGGLPVITSRYNGAAELLRSEDLGSVLENPSDIDQIAKEIARRATVRKRVTVPDEAISLERNVRETLAVLEMAARAR